MPSGLILLLKRALTYYRPDLASIILVCGLEVVGTIFALATPWPLKLIVDGVLHQGRGSDSYRWSAFVEQWLGWLSPHGQILFLCILMAVLSLCSGLLGYASGKLSLNSGLRAVKRLRSSIYQALQYLPLKYHDIVPSADSTYRVTYDSQSLQTLYSSVFLPLLASFLTLVGSLAVMMRLNAPLTLISFLVVPPVFWCLRYYSRNISLYSSQRSENESSMLKISQEVLASIIHVKAHSREQDEVKRFVQAAETSLRSTYLLNKTQMKSGLIVSFVMSTGTAVLYLVGSFQILANALTLGSVLIFANYLAQLYRPIESLSGIVGAFAGAQAALARSFQIFELEGEEDTQAAKQRPSLHVIAGEIKFEDLSFSYERGPLVLDNFSLTINPGEFMAIVGPSGQGKSTLLSLLAGFYSPKRGKITIDDQDISSCTKSSLRSAISFVLQDAILFSGSIADNIGYGRPSATASEIMQAAKCAQAHSFIMRLPGGYQTQLGEGGVKLSGGQRQRLSIARAFLRNSQILVLDEPTSALDNLTESRISDSISNLTIGRTTLLVTHRLALADRADRVAVIQGGTVVELGPPGQLVNAKGHYAKLKQIGNPI